MRRLGELTVLFATNYIQWIILLVVVDVILGLAAALVKGKFNPGKVAAFMGKDIIPYVLGYAVVELVVVAWPAYALLAPVVFVLVVVALVSSILGNLAKLGVPVPKMVEKE